MPPSREQQLRDRIHRIFSSDCKRTAAEDTQPAFWAAPSGEATYEPLDTRLNPAGITEEEWLNEPNPAFDCKSPKDILDNGSDSDRKKLENAICAVEEGAFS